MPHFLFYGRRGPNHGRGPLHGHRVPIVNRGICAESHKGRGSRSGRGSIAEPRPGKFRLVLLGGGGHYDYAYILNYTALSAHARGNYCTDSPSAIPSVSHNVRKGGPQNVCHSPGVMVLPPTAAVSSSPSSLPLSLESLPLFSAASASAVFHPSTTTTSVTPLISAAKETPMGSPQKVPSPTPFRVASSIAPIPGKLVKKIQALEYVEMRELLPDNIALAERMAALPSGIIQQKQLGQRDIGGKRALMTWVSSFATYVAIVAGAHPERVADMLAFMRLVVREANKFGGAGWLTYDAVFRRNHQGTSTPWNYIDASLHQVYVANQRDKIVTPCQHCQEVDHTTAQCAVGAILPKPITPPMELTPLMGMGPDRPAKKGKRPSPYGRQRPVCHSWNKGACAFPGNCTFAHVCSNCYGPHQRSAYKEESPTPPQHPMGQPRRV